MLFALPATVQAQINLREGHGHIIRGAISSVSAIPMTCGEAETEACFTVFPTRTGNIQFQPNSMHPFNENHRPQIEASIRALPFLQVGATTDSCKDSGAAKTMTVTYTPKNGSSTTTTFTRVDDDHWAARICGSNSKVTEYSSAYRHGNGCRAHEEAQDELCIARCTEGQIWRKPGWKPTPTSTPITNSLCETP